jgi:hypothetical protein
MAVHGDLGRLDRRRLERVARRDRRRPPPRPRAQRRADPRRTLIPDQRRECRVGVGGERLDDDRRGLNPS